MHFYLHGEFTNFLKLQELQSSPSWKKNFATTIMTTLSEDEIDKERVNKIDWGTKAKDIGKSKAPEPPPRLSRISQQLDKKVLPDAASSNECKKRI